MTVSRSPQHPPSITVARELILALHSCGVRDVVYCPGSRSAPFAYVLSAVEAAGHMRVHIRLDERNAAFVAVGLSRAGLLASGRARPVAVVTTSGGAVAELHAGVAEASHSRLPLIIVSADRPFEMRDVGASQTTTQVGIFASHIRHTWDIPAGIDADHRCGRVAARAVAVARGLPAGVPGPVHLNVGLRDPLVPHPGLSLDVEQSTAGAMVAVSRGEVAEVPWEEALDPTLRTVIVAGDGADRRSAEWAEAAHVPLLAEPTSGVTLSSAWVAHQQSLLNIPELTQQIEQVLVTGRPTLSRVVSALLARDDVRIVVQSGDSEWVDVAGRASLVIPALRAATAHHEDATWLDQWRSRGAKVSAAVDMITCKCDDADAPTLLSVADALWNVRDTALLIGASNAIRAVDLIARGEGRSDCISNRGLAGIDGTISTAFGLAWGSDRPLRVMLGDLTFFHDASALACAPEEELPHVQCVVVDDGGGAIFASLEHGRAEYQDMYERWFATRQDVSIEALAQAYGVSYERVDTVGQLREVLTKPVRGRSIVHVPVQRNPDLLSEVAHFYTQKTFSKDSESIELEGSY